MANAAAAGDTERAIAAGQRILRIEPLHEPAIRRLMLLYRDNGRRSAAIELYRNFADRLKTELGAQPEPETRIVFAEIGRTRRRQHSISRVRLLPCRNPELCFGVVSAGADAPNDAQTTGDCAVGGGSDCGSCGCFLRDVRVPALTLCGGDVHTLASEYRDCSIAIHKCVRRSETGIVY